MARADSAAAQVNKVLAVDPTFVPPKTTTPAASPAPAANGASTPKAALVRRATPASVPRSPRRVVPENPLLKLAMYAFLGLMGAGFAVFLASTFSVPALAGLGVVGLGALGLINSAMQVFENSGLIAFLPPTLVNILLDWTLMEFILSDNLLRGVKEFIVQVMPIFVAGGDEATQLRALGHMRPATRRLLTQRGIVNLLSPRMQSLLLPRRLRDQLATEPPRYRLSKTDSDPSRLQRLIDSSAAHDDDDDDDNNGENAAGASQPEAAAPTLDLESSRQLFRELLADLVSRRNVEVVLTWVDPNKMRTAAAVLALAGMFQLAVSARARETLKSLITAVVLLGSLAGAAGSAGLFALWLAAKRRKKQMGWE